MARIVILGAGISGHTVARYLSLWLGRKHQVTVVSPKPKWNWIPSNVWVGCGEMTVEQVTFDLAPVYAKAGVEFVQARALSTHPEGDATRARPFVRVEYTESSRAGQTEDLDYDYLVNATGPKLNFGGTPGLGPEGGHTVSVCTPEHALQANAQLQQCIQAMKKGERRRFVVGTGHGMCTCQGAAFEYIYNVDYVLRKAGVRELADIVWISNEYELGDFGMGGVHIHRGGYVTNGKIFAESLMVERGIGWITRAAVNKVEPGKLHYETLDGAYHELDFDFAMLIPPFAGVGLKAFDKAGADITGEVFAPNGFMKVDADYQPKAFEEWSKNDWPKTYESPKYKNVFAVGIAFAPPHPISKVMKSPNGTQISPTPPRTGMPSAAIGRAVAANIRDLVSGKIKTPVHTASMGEMGAACVASTGSDIFKGTAATMTVYPVVPDYETYPEYGRDPSLTFGEIGLAGHWMKWILHYVFMYQAKLRPGWSILPD
ncbi:NAD(P)/FAD-dependent oxidoreductase [Candidatus Thiodictyon syntrophicum]|jgi:sulfide:quinone oxidoreductase|uniref:Sulfide:quinone reductase n=1 Tax=Candidatus Thiodictyon syntrophicum TaxID=1166950 RepID=A0A2K8UJ33_9GAMM|nr:FAD-dependent oxidoreductase [Candidatus Thiodictyon syntrophicum]AUB85576.1 sulfide:quinone reductase [Candidatus Thiodictyon syntrophicum]